MRGNFQAAANFIALSVTPAKQSSRNVAATTTELKGRQGRGGRGIRGGHQPGGRGHNQRGRGHPNNHGRNQGRGHGGRGRGGRGGNQNLGYYTKEEWSALTREQKDSILEARGTKQNVASVKTDNSQQNPPGSDDTGNNVNANAGAGNEFGRRSQQRGANYIGMLYSSIRQITNPAIMERVVSRMASQRGGNRDAIDIGEYIELDSHADTSVIGNNC
jgi:hypothetical protein